MSAAPSFDRQLAVGRVGESLIARWLRSRGHSVMPVYEIEKPEGKGPRLFLASVDLIAPDMLAFKGTGARWIEAKSKGAFTWHRVTGRYVTGIDLRHYLDYLQVDEASPWPVWLMFLQRGGRAKDTPPHVPDSPAGLFGHRLSYLREHENHRAPPSQWGSGGMVYWAHGTLIQLATLEEVCAAGREA